MFWCQLFTYRLYIFHIHLKHLYACLTFFNYMMNIFSNTFFWIVFRIRVKHFLNTRWNFFFDDTEHNLNLCEHFFKMYIFLGWKGMKHLQSRRLYGRNNYITLPLEAAMYTPYILVISPSCILRSSIWPMKCELYVTDKRRIDWPKKPPDTDFREGQPGGGTDHTSSLPLLPAAPARPPWALALVSTTRRTTSWRTHTTSCTAFQVSSRVPMLTPPPSSSLKNEVHPTWQRWWPAHGASVLQRQGVKVFFNSTDEVRNVRALSMPDLPLLAHNRS